MTKESSSTKKKTTKKKAKKATKTSNKSLVIVESPAKAKTINKYLGKSYVVKASMGHVRDLPVSTLGVDIENDFEPTYRILASRRKIATELKKEAKAADQIFLATDLDREGEAIAWHLAEALGAPESKYKRVVFNEITERAIHAAFEQAHDIDMDKVNAQQARRILDRVVGYQLSPLLWKKIAKGLSAGRVQSVAVKLIVDREREVEAFVPEEYWKISAILHTEQQADQAKRAYDEFNTKLGEIKQAREAEEAKENSDAKLLKELAEKQKQLQSQQKHLYETNCLFKADLIKYDGEKFSSDNADLTKSILDVLREANHRIADLSSKTRKERPPAPFTTATLQQQAANRLKFSTARTMRIAQQLYEGVDIGDEGSVGLITYMRTDSTHLAAEAVTAARNLIQADYGDDYLPGKPNVYASRSSAQEAHEAVRATDAARRPENIKQFLTQDQYRLYELIWKRFVACQMPPAQWFVTDAIIEARNDGHTGTFKAIGRRLAFRGFLALLPYRLENADAELPVLKADQQLAAVDLPGTQHFTQPPPRFNEASLVRTLESLGIGRPSTYANIISTIQDRGYVDKRDAKFFPTDLGKVVTDQLVLHFPRIMDTQFTSHMEKQLDKIEESHLDWVAVLKEFYEPFSVALEKAGENMEKQIIESEYDCEQCGKKLMYRWTKTGRFLACSGYPDCKFSASVDEEGKLVKKEVLLTDHKCPNCQKQMILRTSRYGPFLGCSGYPDCKTTMPCDEEGNPLKQVKPEDIDKKCPECGKGLAAKRGRGKKGGFLACPGYPDCKHTEPIPDEIAIDWPAPEKSDVKCPKCGKIMLIRRSRRGPFLGCSGYPKCRTIVPVPKDDEKADTEGKDKNAE